jgi:AAA15 family ATPase/GTPase
MSELLLDSLEIKGYRCFEHLTIEKLGRVNLIVGKNNVGKTALLEALRIYLGESTVAQILFERGEIENAQMPSQQNLERLKEFNLAFYNRPIMNGNDFSYVFTVGPVISRDDSFVFEITNNSNKLNQKSVSPTFLDASTLFISTAGMGSQNILPLWDKITLSPTEDNIIEALNLIPTNILRLNFIGYPKANSNRRVPVVRIKEKELPVLLSSLGDGMNRLLGLALGLVSCKNGVLLIDEIESGFHYSVLPEVWKLIFKTAKDLNVQVFATTHSKDCIEAFTQAAIDDEESEGMLIRLARKDDKIKAFTFDEKELETIATDEIEVR